MKNIIIGIKGTVLALDPGTGQEIWRSELIGSDFVNVVIEDEAVYAATRGELFCLDPATGQIRWRNQLKGLGRGLVAIANGAGSRAVLLREKRRQQEAAQAAAQAAAAAS